jgi:hypothetical protein
MPDMGGLRVSFEAADERAETEGGEALTLATLELEKEIRPQ